MQTNTDTIKSIRLAADMTPEEIAAINFEAWKHVDNEWQPPTNAEWNELAIRALVPVRIAWLSLYKSKPEFVEMVRNLEDEGLMDDLVERLREAHEFFSTFIKVLEPALARLLCAGMTMYTAHADD